MTLDDIKEIEYDLINEKMTIVLKQRIYHKNRMIDKMAIKCNWITFCEKCHKWIEFKNLSKNL